MKKRLILIIFVLLSVINSWAQKNQDVLYLNNGSVIRGTIIEAIPNGNVKIQTMDGSIFVYNMEEVSKIAKDTNEQENVSKTKEKGYVGFVEVSYAEGDFERLYLATTHGYQFNRYLFAGIGVGYEYNLGYIPVYLDCRAKLDKKYSPYIELKTGIELCNGIYYIAPTIGYRFELNKKSAINVGLSLDSYSDDDEWYPCARINYEF